MPPIIIALRGPHARRVGGGPYARASSGLRSTENRVHGARPSLLPPLIVVAGLLLLPAFQTHRPAGARPPARSAPPRGSPAAAAFAGDVCYESRGRLRDGRCAVLGCGCCPVRCGELLRSGGAGTGNSCIYSNREILVFPLLLSDWES